MILKILAALAGFGLIIIGLALIAAELFEPQHFVQIYKDLSAVGGSQVHTNVIGFGVLVVGAALLAVVSNSTPPPDDM
jgi:formate-dependent nitrite reductase membrane component NrfD